MLKKIINLYNINKLKNLHENEECIIIGNGPSVDINDLNKLVDGEKIIFTLNRFYLAYEQYNMKIFKSDYTLSIDPQMIEDFGQDIIDKSKKSKVILGMDKTIDINGDYIKFNIVNTKPFKFSTSPSDFISTGDSVVVFCIQLAYFMGIKKIYLYGVDHEFNYDKLVDGEKVVGGENHFINNYRDDKPWYPPVVENIEKAFKVCDEFLRKKNGFVINCSKKTQLEVLEKGILMIVYESKSSSNNFKENVKKILNNIKKDYYIGYRLARKDIKSNYSKSYLGLFWDFLEPIALSVVFIFLHKSKFLNTEDLTMSYSIFVIFGLLMWQIFNDTLIKSMEIVNSSKTLLSQLNVSTEALIMSVIYRMSFNSIFVISALIIFSFIMNEATLIGMSFFIILFPIIILLGLSIGLFLAPFNTINSDVGSFTKILLRALFFTSAVLFPIPKEGLLNTFGTYNPLVYVFENMRYIAIGHQIDLFAFLSVLGGIFILLMIAWYIFHISIKVLTERV